MNSNPVARLGRLDLDVAIAELAAAAGLLLVAAVGLGRLADRLLVGHVRRVEVDLGAEPRLQPLDDHLDMDLGEPGHDLLAGLLVAVQVDRRVLLLEAAQGGEHLLLVALALGLDREGHHRRRQLDAGHLDWLVAGGQPVAGLGLLELGHGADVAGSELGRVAGARALEGQQRADPLLGVATRVQHLRVLLEHALVDPEQVDPAGERVGPRLEHVREHLPVLDRLERHLAHLETAVLDR